MADIKSIIKSISSPSSRPTIGYISTLEKEELRALLADNLGVQRSRHHSRTTWLALRKIDADKKDGKITSTNTYIFILSIVQPLLRRKEPRTQWNKTRTVVKTIRLTSQNSENWWKTLSDHWRSNHQRDGWLELCPNR